MKNILIIGASSGIGLALTKDLLKDNEIQVITASRMQSPELASSNLPFYQYDVKNAIPNDFSSFIPNELHGLVYTPGTINLKPFQRLTEEDYLADFEVNVMGAIRVLNACFRSLKNAKGSSVVLFSTVAAKVGMSFHTSIAISKSGVEGLTKSLAAEWALQQIRVNVVAPSLTNTPLAAKLTSSEEKIQASAKRHPMGRIGEADDVANVARFLLSDESSWITGQVLGVDGGMSTLKP